MNREEENKMGEHNCYKKDEGHCIQKKAYELWEKDGCKQGHDLDYWLNAENSVRTHSKK
jgi:hypothetical protein